MDTFRGWSVRTGWLPRLDNRGLGHRQQCANGLNEFVLKGRVPKSSESCDQPTNISFLLTCAQFVHGPPLTTKHGNEETTWCRRLSQKTQKQARYYYYTGKCYFWPIPQKGILCGLYILHPDINWSLPSGFLRGPETTLLRGRLRCMESHGLPWSTSYWFSLGIIMDECLALHHPQGRISGVRWIATASFRGASRWYQHSSISGQENK